MRNMTVLPPWVPDFVKGHHFFEDWGTIEHFVPGSAASKEEEAILPDFVYTSPDMQCNSIKDESLDGSISSDSQQYSPEDLFSYLFTSEDEDNVDEDELWAFEIEDGDDDARPVNVVQVHSPMISTPESHTHMLPSFHSGSSLLNLVNYKCPAEPEFPAIIQPLQPAICHASEFAVAAPTANAHAPSLKVIVECAAESGAVELVVPEVVESLSLPASPLEASCESLVDPFGRFSPSFFKSEAEAEPVVNHTNVTESVAETAQSNVVLESAAAKLLRFAKPPSAQVTVDFTRPPSFQAVLEPVVECVEPVFDSELQLTSALSISVDSVPKEQTEREIRAISLYKKVMSWLKKLLPWSKKRKDSSALATLLSCDDTSLWASIKWKFQKMWVPKVKHTQCLKRKRTILC